MTENQVAVQFGDFLMTDGFIREDTKAGIDTIDWLVLKADFPDPMV